MIFELDNEKYYVQWRHIVKARKTYCSIRKGSPKSEPISEARSYVHPVDHYIKSKGRHRSFTRALNKKFSREQRTKIWPQCKLLLPS
jgi:hypothetical protein